MAEQLINNYQNTKINLTIAFKKLVLIILLLPSISMASAKFTINDLLQSSNKSLLTANTPMVIFQQSANTSGGTDATSIAKVTLAYFTSNDCTGAKAGSGFYTTPNNSESLPIAVGDPFSMTAAGAWNCGVNQLGITTNDMTGIQSIAVTFKSTESDVPQAAFTNESGYIISYACVPVTCTAGPGECISGSSTQSFTLKTTASAGDPADGGVIGCINTGSGANLYNLIVATADNATQPWGGYSVATDATSTTNGESNTAQIVTCLTGPGGRAGCPQNIDENTYAAGTCSIYQAAGGYTSGWFLPAGGAFSTISQSYCLYTNKSVIASGSQAAGGSGFSNTYYWTSKENSFTAAWAQSMAFVGTGTKEKYLSFPVRCTESF